MIKPLTGFIGTLLLVLVCRFPVAGQEKSSPAPAATQSAPGSADPQQTAPAADPASPATSDPSQAPAPAAPADQTATPQQTPPAGQTPIPPAGQTPTPPPADQTQHGVVPQPPPPPPKVPDVRRPGESGFWFGVGAWVPKEQPVFNRGNQSTFVGSAYIKMQGTPKFAGNIEAGLAVGLHNTLRMTYTDFRADGDFVTPVQVTAWSQTYAAGTYISTAYHVQQFKLSYEYLTWPFPVGSRKFRLKTLWEAEATVVNSAFDAPKNYYDSNGNLIIDPTTGNPIVLSVSHSKNIFSPLFGLGAYYYPSRHVRLEFNGAGFGWPHKFIVWDTDATVNIRLISHFELRAGARAFSFKTSTNSDYFMKGTFASAFAGIRWYSNSE